MTADGELVCTDHDHEPELFWALRGGGGNFGVVTAIELELYPISQVYAGAVFFDWERSSEVLHAWHEWVPTLPDELTSAARILRFPPLPEIPEAMRGKSFAVVDAAYLGGEADGVELIRPLRELAPAIDTFAIVLPSGSATCTWIRPTRCRTSGHQLLGPLPAAAIDELVALAGPASGSTLLVRSSAISAARSPGASRTTARSRRSGGPSRSSPEGWRPTRSPPRPTRRNSSSSRRRSGRTRRAGTSPRGLSTQASSSRKRRTAACGP